MIQAIKRPVAYLQPPPRLSAPKQSSVMDQPLPFATPAIKRKTASSLPAR